MYQTCCAATQSTGGLKRVARVPSNESHPGQPVLDAPVSESIWRACFSVKGRMKPVMSSARDVASLDGGALLAGASEALFAARGVPS